MNLFGWVSLDLLNFFVRYTSHRTFKAFKEALECFGIWKNAWKWIQTTIWLFTHLKLYSTSYWALLALECVAHQLLHPMLPSTPSLSISFYTPFCHYHFHVFLDVYIKSFFGCLWLHLLRIKKDLRIFKFKGIMFKNTLE